MEKVWKGKFKRKDKKRKLTALMLAATMICGLISAIPVCADESGTPTSFLNREKTKLRQVQNPDV